MEKRRMLFGTYDTAAHGWTLAGWTLSAPEQKTNYIDIPGGDGSWDLSDPDDIPRFYDRTLTVTLESSEWDRLKREDEIRELTDLLHGRRVDIELPDDPLHHLNGRIHVQKEYNDPAHAAVTITATCKPWKFDNDDTIYILTASTTEQTAKLVNVGRRPVVPTITTTGTARLVYGASSISLSAGSYQWPELLLMQGTTEIKYSGSGKITLTYREAVLE